MWSIHHGAELIKMHIPTVTLVNESFVTEALVIAKSRGTPNLPYVTFPYNVEVLSVQEIRSLTDKVFPQIVEYLTNPSSVIAKEHHGK